VLGLKVLAVVGVKISVFWDVMPRIPVKIHRRFGGTASSAASCLHHAGFFLGLLLIPEYGGGIFLLNIG
jgi:hypothetical protein